MADDDKDLLEEAGDDAEAGAQGRGRFLLRLGGRKLALFVALPLLAAAGIGGGVYVSGILDASPESPEQMASRPKVFFDMPEMLVNLADRGEERARYLKLQVSLELPGSEARAALTPVLPRVIDLFQVYLRELRPTDLEGSAGIYRLKEELLRRINLEIQPHRVSDVLFKEIIVQ
jgi:flagellar FliL protein